MVVKPENTNATLAMPLQRNLRMFFILEIEAGADAASLHEAAPRWRDCYSNLQQASTIAIPDGCNLLIG